MSTPIITIIAEGETFNLTPHKARELYERLREVFGDAPRVVHYAPYYTPPAPPWNLGPITVGSATSPITTNPTGPQG